MLVEVFADQENSHFVYSSFLVYLIFCYWSLQQQKNQIFHGTLWCFYLILAEPFHLMEFQDNSMIL